MPASRPVQRKCDGVERGLKSVTISVHQWLNHSDGYELGVTGDLDQDYSVVYGYDNAGRLNTVTSPLGTHTYGYLANSYLRSSVSSAVHTSVWTYEPYSDVITSLENKVGVTSISRFDYAVNSLGQRTQRQQSGTAFGTTSTDVFTYNTKGEVIGSTNATLSARDQASNYDDIGNRLTFTNNAGTTNYTANSLNQYSGILAPGSSLLAPSHDPDGNQTATGLGQAYIWDAENRLISVEPLIPGTGDKKVINTYDGQSRRVRRAVFTYSGEWNLTTDEKFIYDGWNVVAVLGWNPSTSTFDLNKTLTWGLDLSGSLQGAGGVGGLLAVKDGGDIYRYAYDASGNVSEVLNDAGGIAAHYEYDAFGDTLVISGTYAAANEYRFSTKPLDAISGLYYYGYRYYSPSTGRWLSRDPIQERGGTNLYGMTGNDCVNRWDFLGTSWEDEFNKRNNPGYMMPYPDPRDTPELPDGGMFLAQLMGSAIVWRGADHNPNSINGRCLSASDAGTEKSEHTARGSPQIRVLNGRQFTIGSRQNMYFSLNQFTQDAGTVNVEKVQRYSIIDYTCRCPGRNGWVRTGERKADLVINTGSQARFWSRFF